MDSDFDILVLGLKLGGINQTTETTSKSFVTLFLFTFLIHGAAHNISPCFLVSFSHVSNLVLAPFLSALASGKSFGLPPYRLRKENLL